MSASHDILTLGQMPRLATSQAGREVRRASTQGAGLVLVGSQAVVPSPAPGRAVGRDGSYVRPRHGRARDAEVSRGRRAYGVHAAVTGGSARTGYQTHPTFDPSEGATPRHAAGGSATRPAHAARGFSSDAAASCRGARGPVFESRSHARRGSSATGEGRPLRGASHVRARGFEDASSGHDRVADQDSRRGEVPAKGSVARAALGWALGHRLVAVVAGMLVFAALMLYPAMQSYYIARRSNLTLSEQLSDVNATNGALQSQVDSLMTKEGIEDEARRRGYVAEGDTAVDMEGVTDSNDPSSDATATSSAAASSSQDEPWYVPFLDVLFGYNAASQGLS